MSSRRRLMLAAVAVLALLFAAAACSGKDDDAGESTDSTVSPTTAPLAPTETTTAPETTAPDASVTVPPDDATADPDDDTDAFGHTAAEVTAFRQAYSNAFEAECRRIWATSAGPDGLLADPDFPEDTYPVDDCLGELDADWGEFADSVEEATSSGTDDAQIAASDLADPLCDTSGTRCFSYGT